MPRRPAARDAATLHCHAGHNAAVLRPRTGRRGPGKVFWALAQGGYLMFELALVLALACLAAVWGADGWRRQADTSAGNATGAWLLEIRGALARMMARHQDDLAQGLPPRDARGGLAYAEPHAPRLDELIRHGHLPPGFPTASAGGMRVAIRVLRDPACPGQGCRLDALAYSVAPAGAWSAAVYPGAGTHGAMGVAAGGAMGGATHGSPGAADLVADPSAVAAILAAAGGYGGHIDSQAPDLIRGPNFRFPNPLAPDMPRLAVGTVAVWAGLDPAATWSYLRVRDHRNPDFQGNVAAAGTLHAAGRLSTDGHLFVGARARAGDACAPDGLMARLDDGGPLSCIGGRWATSSGFGGAYSINTLYGCKTFGLASTANPRTGACSCPPGYEALMFAQTSDYWVSGEGTTASYLCVR
ncbi:shufflon system plasmid conjugative transfer pilus tip adhesin PilV [Bordetella sp. LUAb4]|uniref:shufflon system plasmid conjugative transfer pilus tip adhesin PilV n=1 Tax=Bordetella sp. LUAb4 TaxID=2843195 RepID=UPI001E40ACD9|nr:shufflon system plasmid conjugative transfer pilus tip adhesin PilV [Bordetella sp. LUAb4]